MKLVNLSKKFVQNIFVNRLKLLVGSLVVALGVPTFLFVTVIEGPELHYRFLEYRVGRVTVKAVNKSGNAGGTGFYVKAPSGKSYIVTNDHVCGVEENNIVYIQHESGAAADRLVPRRIIDRAPGKDLCLIEGYNNYEGAKLASNTKRGDLVWVIGHPRLHNLTLSFGQLINMDYEVLIFLAANVSKDDCSESYMKYVDVDPDSLLGVRGVRSLCFKSQQSYQSNAKIHPGNSGSAVVNAYGNIVAVAYASDMSGFSYFVKLEDLRSFLSVY